MTPDPEVLLHDVQDHGELGKDEDPVIAVLHLWQEVVHDGKLAAVADLVVAQTVVLNTLQKNIKLQLKNDLKCFCIRCAVKQSKTPFLTQPGSEIWTTLDFEWSNRG